MLNLANLFINNPFLARALVACIGISLVCPILGIFLLLRRMSLVGDAISHAILPGVALGFMLGGMSVLSMALGGLVAGVLVTVLAGIVGRKTQTREDASFAGFYLIALALGVVIISKSGTNLDLMHILFGSILSVDMNALVMLAIITSFSLVVLALIVRPIIIDIFDPNLLKNFKVNADYFHLIFLFIVVLNLVIDFQILGTVLVIGAMMLPANIAKLLGRTFNQMLLIGVVASLIASIIGITISYFYDIPTGPAIVLTDGAIYLLAIAFVGIKALIIPPHYKE